MGATYNKAPDGLLGAAIAKVGIMDMIRVSLFLLNSSTHLANSAGKVLRLKQRYTKSPILCLFPYVSRVAQIQDGKMNMETLVMPRCSIICFRIRLITTSPT